MQDLDNGARVTTNVLWHFETLLEHSGSVSGLKGAILTVSGALHCGTINCMQGLVC